jgi:NTE family protein
MNIGIALGSGGTKGFAHIEYLKVIDEFGIKIGAISGASMGALIGAFYAGGMKAAEMEKIFADLTLFDKAKMADVLSIDKAGLVKGRKIEQFLEEKLPVKRFEELSIPLRIVATDYWSKEQVIFDKGDIVPAIRASISVPGLFRPYEYENRLLIDGGVVNPVPFDLLTDDCDFIIGVDVSGEKDIKANAVPSPVEVLLGTFQIMQKVITDQKEKGRHVMIYCKPRLNGIRAFEFYKYQEVFATLPDDIAWFRAELKKHGLGKN